MPTKTPTRVVCLGGGYAAFYLTRALTRAIRRGTVELTVVSRENFHPFHGFCHEMLGGKLQPNTLISPARRMFRPARFHCAYVGSVDVERRTVTTSRVLDGKPFELPYDHLVLALGAGDDLARVPGFAEHALRLRNYWDCFRTRNHLLTMLEMAEIEQDPVERRRLLSFVVAGGNYGGVEVASEINDWARQLLRREYPRLDPAEVSVTLVHSGERILPELQKRQPKLQAYAERFLAESGLVLRCSTRVAMATPEEVVLSSGERIASRTLISCTGIAMPPLFDTLPFARDERGRVVTDALARVVGTENVWAAGDCAAVPDPNGGTCPPLALDAMMVGRQVGRNITAITEGRPPRPYTFRGLGDACALGRRHAVSHLKGIRFYGFPAWVMWRLMFLYFVPTFDRRMRMLVDFLLWPLLGRDIANPRVEEPQGMQRELYEAGQDIVRQGDIGHRLFLLLTGEVDVVQRDADGAEQLLTTLGPGSHFGERAVFQNVRRTATVRAKTRVELVSLGRREAVTLTSAVRPLAEELQALPGASGGVGSLR